MQNHLKNETSPYLLQHADNPVDWYPWCDEAFERAKKEDKPIFLSIGYSTCHWCHVMAHESFEDEQIAEILNKYYISIKVDKEERPDIDSIYMSVCQAFTGSGGWPTTIILTPEQKPFFAGTYFPKTARYGQYGLQELLLAIHEKWMVEREALLESAEEILTFLDRQTLRKNTIGSEAVIENSGLIEKAVTLYERIFDERFGGFGEAPKFPTPHNLLFLMQYYEKCKDKKAIRMVEKTLLQMYRGGIFDHIGGGFSRYSTDPYFLAPHFEKMLYDNSLLILAYCKAYQITGKELYCQVAKKTAAYILAEMTSLEGGFYCAQDADSEGEEGKYYLLKPEEIIELLGEDAGKEFNQYFDITEKGNFEGKSIPNLLKNTNFNEAFDMREVMDTDFSDKLSMVYEYRKNRYALHLDDKILTSWNGLMIAAMCCLYRVSGEEVYLNAARTAQRFLEEKLCEDDVWYVSYRENKRGGRGFLDDYANVIYAMLSLYEATFDNCYLERARHFCKKTVESFYDEEQGGFFLYGSDNEQLILRPKETYDGAMPSGNSVMTYNLVRLYLHTGDTDLQKVAEKQLHYMVAEAEKYPIGYAMFLCALSDYTDSPEKVTIVVKDRQDLADLPGRIPLSAVVTVLDKPTQEYPLKNDKTTFYVCKGRSCRPPVNEYF